MPENKRTKNITSLLTETVSAAFESCGYDPSLGTVLVSDRPDICQFQCNGAFGGAKLYHKSPAIIAQEVADKLKEDKRFAKVEAVKPAFINITLTDEFLASQCRAIAKDEHLGVVQAEKPSAIVIDYGGPNVAKALHIGHLRSAIIGESLKRLARACGHNVIGDAHLGDWGMPMGLVIAYLSQIHPDWKCFSDDFDPEKDVIPDLDVAQLNEIYPAASKLSKEDSDEGRAFKEKAHGMTLMLQSHKKGIYDLWKKIVGISVGDVKRIFSQLNVDFDYWYGESDADEFIPELLDVLGSKGLMHESMGAMVVDVAQEDDKAPMPPVMIKKTDGSVLYDTTDLATLIQREKDFKPDNVWYVADKRQTLHFEQCFRCAKLAGIMRDETQLEYMDFGTMNGADGKPYKTRDGGVMQLQMLLDTAFDAARSRMQADKFDTSQELDDTARKIAIASIKFGDLINHRSKDYIFDLDKFLSADGKTGVYLLYMVTRICSVLRKLGIEDDGEIELGEIYTESERELMLNILLTDETFRHAFTERAPNYVCENAYQLAVLFSKFYQENHIMNESDEKKKSAWINLCRLVKRMLIKHLDVLAIYTVEKM